MREGRARAVADQPLESGAIVRGTSVSAWMEKRPRSVWIEAARRACRRVPSGSWRSWRAATPVSWAVYLTERAVGPFSPALEAALQAHLAGCSECLELASTTAVATGDPTG